MRGRARWLALAALGALACGADVSAERSTRAANGEPLARGASAPYVAVPVPEGGRIAGVVAAPNAAAASEATVPEAARAEVCGTVVRTPVLERARGGQVAGAIVWLEGIRRGKPLPLRRRFELAIERCRYWPRVQAVIAGGMLNVKSGDAIPTRTRFTAARTGRVLATVRQTDAGQLVPDARALARAGLVRVMGDGGAGARAWIRVFAQPYFAVTGRDGRFVLDSVPPGRYMLMTWQERLGTIARPVTVRARDTVEARIVY